MKRGFTLIELLIVIAIAIIIVVICAANIQGCTGGTTTSIPASNGVTVDNVKIGVVFDQAAAYQQAIVDWSNRHPDREIISVMKAEGIGGREVIITSREKK
jgi:prepilin-type N-terminal cleavage/methylation domain-containing protein